MLERGGVMEAVERSGTQINPARVISNLVFWLVMFAVILVAANASGGLQQPQRLAAVARRAGSDLGARVIVVDSRGRLLSDSTVGVTRPLGRGGFHVTARIPLLTRATGAQVHYPMIVTVGLSH